jgi:hypothetical protein
MLVGEPREQDGLVVELFEFASKLQQHRTMGEGVRDQVRLRKRLRMRDPLHPTGQRPFGIT